VKYPFNYKTFFLLQCTVKNKFLDQVLLLNKMCIFDTSLKEDTLWVTCLKINHVQHLEMQKN